MPTCGENGGLTVHGKPCSRGCNPGYTRCNLHGGASPVARIKAEQALAQARLPACEALYTIIERWATATCPTCGFPKGDNDETRSIIRAAQVILDRTGLGPHATLELVPQSDGDLNLDLMMDEERAEFAHLVNQFQRLKAAVKARLGMLPIPAALPAAVNTESVIEGSLVP